MGKEILAIPEQYLDTVIVVIRNGIHATINLDAKVKAVLEKWCEDEEDYLNSPSEEIEESQ